MKLKHLLAAGLVVAVATLFAGVAFAQGPGDGPGELPPPPDRPPRLEVVAGILGMPVDELRDALKAGQTPAEIVAGQGKTMAYLAEGLYNYAAEQIAAAVADGKMEQARADKILAGLAARRDACVNDGRCQLPPPRRPQPRNTVRRAVQMGQIVADTLGMSGRELLAALKEGQTLKQIAAAQGVSLDAIADALYNAAAERLEKGVTGGAIDPVRAGNLQTRLAALREACAAEGRCLPLPGRCAGR